MPESPATQPKPLEQRSVTLTLLVFLALGYGPQDLNLGACLTPPAREVATRAE